MKKDDYIKISEVDDKITTALNDLQGIIDTSSDSNAEIERLIKEIETEVAQVEEELKGVEKKRKESTVVSPDLEEALSDEQGDLSGIFDEDKPSTVGGKSRRRAPRKKRTRKLKKGKKGTRGKK